MQVGSYAFDDKKMQFEATQLRYSEENQKAVIDYKVDFRFKFYIKVYSQKTEFKKEIFFYISFLFIHKGFFFEKVLFFS